MKNNKEILFKFEHLYNFVNIDEFLSIPLLTIDFNKKNAIYLIGENHLVEDISLTNFLKKTISSTNYFIYDKQNNLVNISTNIYRNSNKIKYFDLNNLDSQDNEIPLLAQLKNNKKVYKIDTKRKNQIIKLFNENSYFVKNELLKICYLFNVKLKDFFRETLKEMSEVFSAIFSQTNKEKERYIEKLQNYFEFVDEKEKEIVELELNFLKEIGDKVNKIYESSTKLTDEQIDFLVYKSEYSALQKIKEKSQKNLRESLFIRDERMLINSLENMLEQKQEIAKQYYKHIWNSYLKKAKIFHKKASDFKELNSMQKYLIKNAYLNLNCYKLIKKNYKKMTYLSIDDIDKMVENLEFEQKLFSINFSNKLSATSENSLHTSIKKNIEENFYFSLDSYISRSKTNFDTIKEKINSHILNLKKHLFHSRYQQPETSKDFELKKIKSKIDNIKAITEWNNKNLKQEYFNSRKIYGNDIKTTFNEIFNFKNKIIKNNNFILKFLKKMIWQDIDNETNDELINFLKVAEESNEYNKKFNFITKIINDAFLNIDNIYKLKRYIKEHQLLFKILFLDAKTSVKHKNLIRPFSSLDYINKIKLLITSKMVSSPELLVIKDLEIDDHNIKNEIWRSINELCKNNNTTQLVLVKEKEMLEKFDNIFVIHNNKLIEFGTKEEIMNFPIHTILKANLKKSNVVSNDIYFNEYEYLYSNIYYANDEHFVVGPLKWVKEWIKKSSRNSEKIIENELEETDNKIIVDTLTHTQENELFDETIETETLIFDCDLNEDNKQMFNQYDGDKSNNFTLTLEFNNLEKQINTDFEDDNDVY
ncbi:MAG1360 family OppF-related protein [Mycoplasmopsis hyopharyngis]|uniref:MAG1360 family OppF-related protein n=1 Tax=Mycoplasmopsis hyopharyngis TaxID=29558 RepID=UPI0038735601